jgi:hypothetical protein
VTQIEASTASDNSTIRRLALRIDRQMLLTATLLFTLSAALFAFVQFGTPNLADNDGFYHMRMGALIREQGLRVSFPWLPLTILGPNAFYDHHLLFHVYLSLFGGNGSEAALLLGAKIASVIMPALACMAIWWLLRGQRVRRAALWSIGLFAVSQAFLYRMSMPRAQRLIPIGLPRS